MIVSCMGGHPQLSVEYARALEGVRWSARVAPRRHWRESDLAISAVWLRITVWLARRCVGLFGEGVFCRMRPKASLLSSVRPGTPSAEVLLDLDASGLVRRSDSDCRLAARILNAIPGGIQTAQVPRFQVARLPSDEHIACVRLLWTVENTLRALIVTELHAVSSTWWNDILPEQMRAEAELRLTTESDESAREAQVHPISFLTLGELFDADPVVLGMAEGVSAAARDVPG